MTNFDDNIFGAYGSALTLHEVYKMMIFSGSSLWLQPVCLKNVSWEERFLV